MTRFRGKVGFAESTDQAPGVTQEEYTENIYYGDILRNTRRLETGDKVNDNIVVNNSISILADAYAFNHFFAIRYVEWMGTLWKVTNVEVQRPRLILTIGGVFNGATSGVSQDTGGHPGV